MRLENVKSTTTDVETLQILWKTAGKDSRKMLWNLLKRLLNVGKRTAPPSCAKPTKSQGKFVRNKDGKRS